MNLRATVLRTDGRVVTRLFDDDPPIEWLRRQVGGYLEILTADTRRVIVNDEAVRKGLPAEPRSTPRASARLSSTFDRVVPARVQTGRPGFGEDSHADENRVFIVQMPSC